MTVLPCSVSCWLQPPSFHVFLGSRVTLCELSLSERHQVRPNCTLNINAKDNKDNLGLLDGANHDNTTGASGITSTNSPLASVDLTTNGFSLLQKMVKDIDVGTRPSFSPLVTLLFPRARYTASAFTSAEKQTFALAYYHNIKTLLSCARTIRTIPAALVIITPRDLMHNSIGEATTQVMYPNAIRPCALICEMANVHSRPT